MTWIIIITTIWLASGVIAYFHRIYGDKKNFDILHPIFLKDRFFYDSLLNGSRAFYFEFF